MPGKLSTDISKQRFISNVISLLYSIDSIQNEFQNVDALNYRNLTKNTYFISSLLIIFVRIRGWRFRNIFSFYLNFFFAFFFIWVFPYVVVFPLTFLIPFLLFFKWFFFRSFSLTLIFLRNTTKPKTGYELLFLASSTSLLHYGSAFLESEPIHRCLGAEWSVVLSI